MRDQLQNNLHSGIQLPDRRPFWLKWVKDNSIGRQISPDWDVIQILYLNMLKEPGHVLFN